MPTPLLGKNLTLGFALMSMMVMAMGLGECKLVGWGLKVETSCLGEMRS